MAEHTPTTAHPRTYTVRWRDPNGTARERRSTSRREHVAFLLELLEHGIVGSPEQRRSRFLVIEGGQR